MKLNGTRSFLAGRTAGEAVEVERKDTLLILAEHRLMNAAFAFTRSASSFHEFMAMRNRLLAGGYHRVRLTGGRSIDG